MSLEEWFKNRWLKPHKTSPQEVDQLLRKIDRDLDDAVKPDISLDWRLAIAYNACLGVGTIALRVSGYRTSEGEGHHYRTLESLHFTIKAEDALLTTLQAIRKKRSVVSYDAAGTVTATEVEETIQLAKELRELLIIWLRETHSNLITD